MTYRFVPVLCALLISGCGGGNADPVTGITATNLKYGQTATLTLQGNALDNAIKVTSPACSQLMLMNITSAQERTALCVVAKTGTSSITVSSSSDYVVYTGTLTVPEPQVTLKTSLGDIVVELNPTAAPISVKNYLAYVNQNPSFYKDTIFHRVEPTGNFVVQGGGFTTGMTPKTGQAAAIKLESSNGLKNLKYTIGMARTTAVDSATSQFYFNLRDNAGFDYQSTSSPGYAVFGKVVTGSGVLDTIATQPTGTTNGYSNVPITDITVLSAAQTQ